MVYEYIQGNKISSNEHMLSANEIARLYGVFTLNGGANGRVIRVVIEDRSIMHDCFYYPCRKGVMQVFPACLYGNIISDWLSGITDDVPGVYYSNKYKEKINFIVKRGELL